MAEQQEPIGHKNEKVGTVVSTKMEKTIVVEVSRRVPHPMYKRIITKRKKFYAHDENSTAKTGDTVRIIEHRPLSKLKRWTLGDIVRRAVQVGVEPDQVDPVAEASTGAAGKSGKSKK
jgi:small subunit ribosomal protein S17